MKPKKFTPLVFLASLGAGGIAVMPFVVMQYTIEHGEGLITRAGLWSIGFSSLSSFFYLALEMIMIIFTIFHFALTIYFSFQFAKWAKTSEAKELIGDPLKNTAFLAPFISLLMTMNIFIGPLRYFIPALSDNFQSLFAPAMAFWSVLYLAIMFFEIHLLSVSFRKGFDISKISFGWLLHPFLLGMLTVIGTGIAAMSKNASIADSAAFMSLISGSMGIFLLIVKMLMIFKSHFAAQNLPENNFLPSFFIVIPNITLFAISAFRLGHYLEKRFAFHLDAYFFFVIGVSFAFEIWYILFGAYLLSGYFKENHFKEFYVTQWGLICPIVAYAVLGGFAYEVLGGNIYLYGSIIAAMILAIVFYFELLFKHIKCLKHDFADPNCS